MTTLTIVGAYLLVGWALADHLRFPWRLSLFTVLAWPALLLIWLLLWWMFHDMDNRNQR